MLTKHKVLIKLFLILAVIPFVAISYEYGPPPGATGAPGDNKNGCAQGGSCHVGTPNTAGGSITISLPAGATTYTPGGAAIPVSVTISDPSMKSHGFQLTARSGSAGTTQAGDLNPSDGNTQTICADGSAKPAGKACSAPFTIQDIEHTETGWSNSIQNVVNGASTFTYTFNWTPPATNVGNVTLYVAANCGTGTASVVPTHEYLSRMVLTPGSSGPAISNVLDAASGRASIVPGAWVAIYGSGLAGTIRTWQAADFNNGNNLPTALSGVSVNFGTVPAAVFFISPNQIDVQAPSGISGTTPVTVTFNGTTTSSFTATVAQNAPSLFTYPSGSNTFAAATHVSGQVIGDPAVTAGTAKASSGETIVLYVNALASSPSGVIVSAPISYSSPVNVNVGSSSGTVKFVGLVAAGEYQINVTLPSGLAAGLYTLTVQTAGQSSQTGVMIPVGP